MPKSELIRGKIAAVVSETSVVINRGGSHGVKGGMKFTIYIEVGPVEDPDDPKNTIQTLRYKKGTIEATSVLEKMSICSIEGTWQDYGEDDYDYREGTTVYPGVASPLISRADLVITVGDLVEQVEVPDIRSMLGLTSIKTEKS